MKKIIKIILFLTLTLLMSLTSIKANEKIKIGLLIPLTGENSEIGESIINSVGLGINKINNSSIEIIPKDTEKYMCDKHLSFFKIKLTEWKKELVTANNEALYHGSMDDNSVSADIVDQASSYTDKTVEMKAINRQIKLISKIDQALIRIKDKTFGFCAETAEPIGIKRLMARPVAHLCIAAQEKHEKDEKVYADD